MKEDHQKKIMNSKKNYLQQNPLDTGEMVFGRLHERQVETLIIQDVTYEQISASDRNVVHYRRLPEGGLDLRTNTGL